MIKNFVTLSRYAGQRFDLVQAGGGNTSVKLNANTMLIKASGWTLSQVNKKQGYVHVNLSDGTALPNQTEHPSIETSFHTMLNTYVLHTHPIIVNAITCRTDWHQLLTNLFPDALAIPYHTPGKKLAQAIKQACSPRGTYPPVIFLQNHGLIVHDTDVQKIIDMTEHVLTTIESYLAIPPSPHKLVTKLSHLIAPLAPSPQIVYLSQDATIQQILDTNKTLLFADHLCPDSLVYCGFTPVELTGISDSTPLITHHAQWHEHAKLILYDTNLFIIAPTIAKARQIETVYKAHLLTAQLTAQHHNPLPQDELQFLAHWDAEKYRKTLEN